MKHFNIVKKNRKYFAAILENGFKCKILIDDNSQDLEIGEYDLEVDDISVRTKYGTDLIFKLSASEQEDAGICTLRSLKFNKHLSARCKELGGKWDGDAQAYVFSGLVEDLVEELDEIYNSPVRAYEITYTERDYGDCDSLFYCGYPVAKATGRDSGAKLNEGVALVSGSLRSGGSVKNWATIAEEGTVVRLEMAEGVVEKYEADHENISCKKIH